MKSLIYKKNNFLENNIYYDALLSEIHHNDFGLLAKKAADYILQVIENEKLGIIKLIDLGCGSGITASILTQHGHEVIGVDYSEDMIALARKNAPMAKFIHASLFDYSIPSCQIVSAIGEPFNYLFDHKSNPEQIKQLFHKIYASLQPDGYFIFDILAPGTLSVSNPQKRMLETPWYSMLIETSEDPDSNILTREITVFHKQGDMYQRSKEIHRQQLYETSFILQILKKTGFQTTLSDHYLDYPLRKGHYAFFCKKRASKSISRV